jgi:hypothetical protein
MDSRTLAKKRANAANAYLNMMVTMFKKIRMMSAALHFILLIALNVASR